MNITIMKKHNTENTEQHSETRHVVIYGYTRRELSKIISHFETQLPEYVRITVDNSNLVTKISLTGINSGVELLRFQMNKFQRNLSDLFSEETVAQNNSTVPEVLGHLLTERELTISCAESCTGGNLAHRIVQVPGSSTYFLGSVVSYSNDVKANVLHVSRSTIDKNGAVSRPVVEEMVHGVCKLMRTDCGIATSGIAGPDGGTKYKPVGTVWIAVKCLDRVVSECIHFDGNRNEVIESATNHGMFMLIRMLRNTYVMQEDFNDE